MIAWKGGVLAIGRRQHPFNVRLLRKPTLGRWRFSRNVIDITRCSDCLRHPLSTHCDGTRTLLRIEVLLIVLGLFSIVRTRNLAIG